MSYLKKGSFSIIHISILWKNSDFAAYIGKFNLGASEIDTPIEDAQWGDHFVERIRISDHESFIGVQASESMDFQRKVMILCNTFVIFLKKWWFRCIHSKILLLGPQKSTPLSRMCNWVAVSSREFEGPRNLDRAYVWISCRHSLFQWKNYVFAAYIWKFCIWVSEIFTPLEDPKLRDGFLEGIRGSNHGLLGCKHQNQWIFKEK